MITTPEEYQAHLSQIQNNCPPHIALIPNREKVYNIDVRTRIIESPQFLGVEKDHAAETIYFLIDRYHDYMDLCNTTCVIEYINAERKARIYPVPFYDISSYPGKMLIPWNVGAGATVKKGTIQYSIKFYKLDPLGTKFEYNFNLLPATSEVLHGMDGASFDTEDFILTADQYTTIINEINKISRQDIFWVDLYN